MRGVLTEAQRLSAGHLAKFVHFQWVRALVVAEMRGRLKPAGRGLWTKWQKKMGLSTSAADRLLKLATIPESRIENFASVDQALRSLVPYFPSLGSNEPKKSGARQRREEHAERLGAPAAPLTAEDVDQLAAEHAAETATTRTSTTPSTATSKPPPQHPRETAAQEDYRQRYNKLKRHHGALRGRLETDAASGNPYAASLLARFFGKAVK